MQIGLKFPFIQQNFGRFSDPGSHKGEEVTMGILFHLQNSERDLFGRKCPSGGGGVDLGCDDLVFLAGNLVKKLSRLIYSRRRSQLPSPSSCEFTQAPT